MLSSPSASLFSRNVDQGGSQGERTGGLPDVLSLLLSARYDEGTALTIASSLAFEYLPFGGGARRCIGAAFALHEMKLVLASILRKYDLRPAI